MGQDGEIEEMFQSWLLCLCRTRLESLAFDTGKRVEFCLDRQNGYPEGQLWTKHLKEGGRGGQTIEYECKLKKKNAFSDFVYQHDKICMTLLL